MEESKKSEVKAPRRFSFNEYFVPTEKRDVSGSMVFKTQDKTEYVRDAQTGTIRRAFPKVNGKKARKARQCQRSTQR